MPGAVPSPKTSAVLPVGGPTPLLAECLEAIRSQARALDELIVVDDSRAGALEPIEGARVLRSGGSGPYAARNVGWQAAQGEVIFFLDIRSRPRPDWAQRLAELFDDPTVALAGSDVLIRRGATLGARVSERQQFYKLEKYTTEAWFRPYFPTCNLAARRSEVEAVGGFKEIRSGADADLCWRILDRPGRRLETIPEVLMEWVPRETLRGYLEQNYRYGRSHCALRTMWRERGAPQSEPMSYPLLARRIAGVVVRGGVAALRRQGDEVLEELRKAGRFAYHVGYRRAAARQ